MKVQLVFAIATLLFTATGVMAQGIDGSDHDFSGKGWNNTGEICVVCHTPHNADGTVTEAPLWNHETTQATFTLYASSTLDATIPQPDGSSKMCLSCHDGTVAVDNFGGNNNGQDNLSGNELLGTNLGDDHPVSMTYNLALSSLDGELYDPAVANSGLGGTIAADMLIGGKMQCSSCHDVHNGAGLSNLLVKSNSASALCLTCHNK